MLKAATLLDTPQEESFDRFARLASAIMQTPVALVSLVDKHRQFFKSCVGLPEPWAQNRQTPLTHSFCQHVVSTGDVLSVADARTHPLLKTNLAIAELGVIAYLGIPLTTNEGYTLGSFCVIDDTPREWTPKEINILKELAALVIDEIELRLLAQQLHTDYLQLRSLELYREEMTQRMVHDLRNPLTSFLGGLELIDTAGPLTPQQQNFVRIAHEGGETLSRMINSILDERKAKLERIDLTLSAVDPNKLMKSVHENLAPMAKQVQVQFTCEPVACGPFMADLDKLRRVLENLVSNAIQNTPPHGKITLSAKTDKVPTICFSVIDTGHGIPTDAFERIFQKLGGAKTIRDNGESTGLGLPFSRMAIKAHGGRIWVESKLGHGTQFYFTIPLIPDVSLRATVTPPSARSSANQ